MSTIYLVTAGCYSNYHFVMAFANKEDAERHVEEWNALCESEWDKREVEECEMHEGPLPVMSKLTCKFSSAVVLALRVERLEEIEPTTEPVPVQVNRHDGEYPYLFVLGTDHERVRKVFTEQLAEFKLQHNLP